MCASLEEPLARQSLQEYYKQDDNGSPLVHVLQHELLASKLVNVKSV